jgi:hypothetical protein
MWSEAPETPASRRLVLVAKAFAVNHLGQHCHYDKEPEFRGVIIGYNCSSAPDDAEHAHVIILAGDTTDPEKVGAGTPSHSSDVHLIPRPPGSRRFYLPIENVVLDEPPTP